MKQSEEKKLDNFVLPARYSFGSNDCGEGDYGGINSNTMQPSTTVDSSTQKGNILNSSYSRKTILLNKRKSTAVKSTYRDPKPEVVAKKSHRPGQHS